MENLIKNIFHRKVIAQKKIIRKRKNYFSVSTLDFQQVLLETVTVKLLRIP